MAHYRYEPVPGFFKQDDPNFVQRVQFLPSFGLLDEKKDRWQTFQQRIRDLNAKAPKGTQYKLLIVARHGQGWHNVGGTKYGEEAWDNYWSKLNGDGEIVWGPDPLLTPQGEAEAQKAHNVWEQQLKEGMPLPMRWFSSPFTRAANTLRITFAGIANPRPMILENLREMIGTHTCDKRSPRAVIQQRFPEFDFEDGFVEQDELWTPDVRETDEQMVVRLTAALDTIMSLIKPEDVYISITAHSGTARAIMAAVGHPRYDLPTGGVMPMVIAVGEVVG